MRSIYQNTLRQPASLPILLLGGFGLALFMRVSLGGHYVAQSQPAALIFAGCLYTLAWAAGTRVLFNKKSMLIGLAGGLFLCLPALLLFATGKYILHPAGNYWSWAIIVTFVAFAEEAFLRGVLYDVIKKWRGVNWAIIIPAIAFAALHVPLYGWHVLPLDLAVGLWLGVLRKTSGSFIAPGIAHTLADLIAWWL